MKTQKFQVGDTARVIYDSAWKGKTGRIHSFIKENNCYRLSGVEEGILIAFHEDELEKVHPSDFWR